MSRLVLNIGFTVQEMSSLGSAGVRRAQPCQRGRLAAEELWVTRCALEASLGHNQRFFTESVAPKRPRQIAKCVCIHWTRRRDPSEGTCRLGELPGACEGLATHPVECRYRCHGVPLGHGMVTEKLLGTVRVRECQLHLALAGGDLGLQANHLRLCDWVLRELASEQEARFGFLQMLLLLVRERQSVQQ